MVGELPTNARGSGSSEIVTPSTVIAEYIILIIILGILTFRIIPKDKEYKATAAVGGMGITLLLGLMTQSLTVLNARDQIRAARGNL